MLSAVATGASLLHPGAGLLRAALRLKPARLQRMDRLCALALVAADAALFDAGLDLTALAALSPARLAIVVGTRFGCHSTSEEYYRGLLAEGPRGASPRLFTYTLPSSPLGELAIHFRAHGPAQTVASGRHAGIEAIGRATRLCATGRAGVAIAVAVEVGGGALVGAACDDGSAAVILESEASARAGGRAPRARLAGSGVAFVAGQPAAAEAAARASVLREAGMGGRPPEVLPARESGGAVAAVAALAAWLRAPRTPEEACLALASDEAGGAAAVLAVGAGVPVSHPTIASR